MRRVCSALHRRRSGSPSKRAKSKRIILCRMVRGSSADQRSANRRLSASFIARGRTQITPRDRIQISKTSSLQSHRQMGVMKQDCTTRRRNAHGIAEYELLYPWPPWAGGLVHIHEVVEKAGREVASLWEALAIFTSASSSSSQKIL